MPATTEAMVALQLAASGLAMGGIYALIALGFTLLWNTGSIINFAHGEFAMLGMFFALTFLVFWKWPLLLALVAAVVTTGAVGLIVERGAIRHLYRQDPITIVIVTIGLQIFLQNVAKLIWGPAPYSFPRIYGEGYVTSFHIAVENLWVAALVLLVIVFFQFLFTRTKLGLAMRCVAQDEETAALMAIPVARVRMLSFVLSAGLGAVGGVLTAPLLFVSVDLGLTFVIKAFISAVVGGFGNYLGALIGALLIGVVDNLASFYISPDYRDVMTFTLLILILVFRPSGLLKATGST